jgi:ribosomal protein S18 acetylase RimI-like enzyme
VGGSRHQGQRKVVRVSGAEAPGRAAEPPLSDGKRNFSAAEVGLESSARVRLAQPSDSAAIASTLHAAFSGFEASYTALAFAATAPTPEEVAGRFAEGPIWVATQDHRVLGTVSVVPQGRDLYIRSMAVHPTARGQGIASRLLLAIEDFAMAEGYGRLVLTTTPFLAAAIALYERAGFRLTGEHGDLFGTPLLWMAKDLLAEA